MCKKLLFISVVVLAVSSASLAYMPMSGFNVSQQNGAYRPGCVPYNSSLQRGSCGDCDAVWCCGCPGIGVAQGSSVGVCQSASACGVCGPSGACQSASAQGSQMQAVTPAGGMQTQGLGGGMNQTAYRTGGYTTGAAMQSGGAGQYQSGYTPINSGQQYQSMGSMQNSMAIGSPTGGGVAGAGTSGQSQQLQMFF